MIYKYGRLICLMALLSVGVVACSTFDRGAFGGYQDIPGNSLVGEAPALYEQVLLKLHHRIEESFQCSKWRILDTTVSHSVGTLTFDSLGEIVNGVVVEEWVVKSCGVERYLAVAYMPSEQGSLVVVPKE